MSITMNDVKHMDCGICGHRMIWEQTDDEVYVSCEEKSHPGYRFELEM